VTSQGFERDVRKAEQWQHTEHEHQETKEHMLNRFRGVGPLKERQQTRGHVGNEPEGHGKSQEHRGSEPGAGDGNLGRLSAFFHVAAHRLWRESLEHRSGDRQSLSQKLLPGIRLQHFWMLGRGIPEGGVRNRARNSARARASP
jgi:hypothetical protein